jgi:hypothetical protein
MFDLWNNNGKCPPTLMAEIVWVPIFVMDDIRLASDGKVRITFHSRPGTTYTIEYTDHLGEGATWHLFQNNGTFTATATVSAFEDDFTSNSSGTPSAIGARFYRFKFNGTP